MDSAPTPPNDVRLLAQVGIDALRRGDSRQARHAFERLRAAGQADAASLVALAYACRSLGDGGAARAAVDNALALEPQNLRALILKADHLAEDGDDRAASSFYQTAVRIAPPSPELPADLRDELSRAEARCAYYAEQFQAFLLQRLSALNATRQSSRFAQSLDILCGKKTVYFQQPKHYFFPELPQIQFYDDLEAFPWIGAVEAGTDEIRAELLSVLKDESRFKPYVEGTPNRPYSEQRGMLNNPDWSAFYLWKDGQLVEANAERCPGTMRILEHVPLTRMNNRCPSVLFSLLRPGAHIPPHCGLVNTRLICHLPLLVPPGCSFRVGNDIRVPSEGKVWIFDDTMEHEAWNRSDQMRVILLFEVWRPELSADERALVAAMFEALDAYRGDKPVWEI